MRRIPGLVLLVLTTAVFGQTPEDPAFRSSEGYGETRWGMTRAEVQSLYPDARNISGRSSLVVTNQSVAGKSAALVFVFAEDRLIIAGPQITEKYINRTRYVYDYQELKRLLITKYGPPQKDETVWLNSLYRSKPEDWGTALGAGHLTMYATWSTPATAIELSVTGEKFEVKLKVRYASKELADLAKRTDQAEKLKGL